MDLARCLDQVLQVGACEEVSQRDEFAVVLVLDVNHTPAVLPATDLPAIDNNILLAANYSEGNGVLRNVRGSPDQAVDERNLP